MRGVLRATVALSGLLVASVKAQTSSSQPQCDPSNLCPQDTPCCSQYGQCGVGAYCLGGCDPRSSHSLDSCMPEPVCSNEDFKFTSMNGIMQDTQYLGNTSGVSWVASGAPKPFNDGGTDVVLLTMPQNSVGTVLASSSYVWYGKISATLKTSRTQGVVTAFIMLSDVKDEIDFEFVGYDLSQAQSNFYWQGVNNFTNGRNHSVSDTFDNYHTYEIDWKPDTLTWSIDGNIVRTLNQADTWNASTNSYGYPQTPARVQMSIWPAGSKGEAAGTIAWAGGLINWDSPDVQQAGYFYAMVKELSIQCYSPPQGASQNGNESYIYDNNSGFNNTVQITNKDTVLKSLLGTGLNPNINTVSGSAPSSTPTNLVPGADSGQGGAGNGNNANQGGSGGSPSAGAPAPSGSTYFGFSQGSTSESMNLKDEKVLRGSILAVVLAIAGLLAM